MIYENRDLEKLCYELECQLRLPGICEGGIGEPCHANWGVYGKGKSIKAHSIFVASGCRACHRELDQGSTLSGEARRHYWEAAFVATQVALWSGGFIAVAKPSTQAVQRDPRPSRERRRTKQRSTSTPSKVFPRGQRIA